MELVHRAHKWKLLFPTRLTEGHIEVGIWDLPSSGLELGAAPLKSDRHVQLVCVLIELLDAAKANGLVKNMRKKADRNVELG